MFASLVLRRIVLPCWLWVGGIAVTAWAQPELQWVSPGAVRPGEEVTLDLQGNGLTGELVLWTSFPAELLAFESLDEEPQRVRCRIRVPEHAPLGVGAVRLASPSGIAGPALVLVDDMATVTEASANHSTDSAQELQAPVAVYGSGQARAVDYFVVRGEPGKRLSVECYATRLGSTFDPVLRLLDSAGHERAYADDSPTGGDAGVTTTYPADGVCYIELRDSRFGAGRYRLRVGDFPLVSAAYPLGARRGSTIRQEWRPLEGSDVPAVAFLTMPPAGSYRRTHAVRFADGVASALVTTALGDLPEYGEMPNAANDTMDAGLPVALPAVLNGVLEESGDRDLFRFAATKGQTLVFQSETRVLGAPTLPHFEILAADGTSVASSAVGPLGDETLTWVVPEDGEYGLLVQDLLRRGGDDLPYRIVADHRPKVALSIADDPARDHFRIAPSVDSISSGAISLDVQCQRFGYTGAVHIRPAESSSTVRVLQGTIPANADRGRVILEVPELAVPGSLVHLRLEGVTDGDPGRSFPVQSTNLQRVRWPRLVFPPSSVDGRLFAVTTGEQPAWFRIGGDEGLRVPVPAGQTETTGTFAVERLAEEFKEQPHLLFLNLPTGVSASTAYNQEQDQFVMTFQGAVPPDDHRVTLVAFAEWNGIGRLVRRELVLAGVPNNSAPDSDDAESDTVDGDDAQTGEES